MYSQFDLATPSGLGEALDALGGVNNSDYCLPIAGGTNVIVDLRARSISPEKLISLSQLTDIRGIEEANGSVIMGGGTTVSDLLRHPDMRRLGSSLVDSARVFAGQMVRNTATVAGNICCASPAADLVPPLLVLDAVVTLESKQGKREFPLSEFYLGYKSTVRKPDELLTRVCWPTPASNSVNLFYKLARRKGDAITVVGIAVALTLEGDKCTQARIALGAVAPIIKRAVEAESLLEDKIITSELIDAAAQKAVEESNPIDDVRASAKYRRHTTRVLTRRLLTQAWEIWNKRKGNS